MATSPGLERFVSAQAGVFNGALAELRRGQKRTHWMWFVFPQLIGLGRSLAANTYGIVDLAEARDYLDHPLLGPRYMTCVEVLQDLPSSDPASVFGTTDAMKLKSSLTLFEAARPCALFAAALDRWFAGERDTVTLGFVKAE